jgi:hypothetical protein
MVTDNDRFGHEGNLFTGMDYTKKNDDPCRAGQRGIPV